MKEEEEDTVFSPDESSAGTMGHPSASWDS